ncbi:hypothetical protein FGIG_04111 [Fasciola gigantica]|uniref:Uncharacterized protein n=1 Tax=Fasciola gigantica TaxID=46835 RepID=A0A504YHI8_FASGI|nr:hypothetical protein FGIG_04111 [Fasciola gigantica]
MEGSACTESNRYTIKQVDPTIVHGFSGALSQFSTYRIISDQFECSRIGLDNNRETEKGDSHGRLPQMNTPISRKEFSDQSNKLSNEMYFIIVYDLCIRGRCWSNCTLKNTNL